VNEYDEKPVSGKGSIRPGEEALRALYKEQIYRLGGSDFTPSADCVKSTQKALIVLPLSEADPNSPQGLMLDRLLGAVGMDRSGCRLVDAESGGTYRQWAAETLFDVLLAFGGSGPDLGLQVLHRPCQIVRFQERMLIFCPALTELASDPAAKKVLWTSLQQAFGKSAAS
jgi:hypothetical protein